MIRWTAAKIALLGTMTDKEVAEKIGTSYQSARKKRIELGIPRRCKHIWPPEAIAMLGKAQDRVVAEKFGFNLSSVFKKRHELDIEASHNHDGRKRDYSKIEPLLGKVSDSAIGRLLGVTHERIRQIRAAYKLPKFRLYPPGKEVQGAVVVKHLGAFKYRLRCRCGKIFTITNGLSTTRTHGILCRDCQRLERDKKYIGFSKNRLTCVGRLSGRAWLFDCSCGTKGHKADIYNVKKGWTQSCGCVRQEYFHRNRSCKDGLAMASSS